jgi:hypothetical protein
LEKNLAKVWTFLRELASAFWGDDVRRDNGLRSQVGTLKQVTAELEDGLATIESRLQHYLDSEREETCHGLAEFRCRDAEEAADAEEEVPVKTARIQADAATRVQIITLVGVMFMGLIQLAGVILSITQGRP